MILSLRGKIFFCHRKKKIKTRTSSEQLLRFAVGIVSLKNSFKFFSFPPVKTFRDLKELFAISYLQCWLPLKEKQIKTLKTILAKKERKTLNSLTGVTLPINKCQYHLPC